MHKKNRNKILIVAIFSLLLLIAIITRVAYKSSFAIDIDLSKLDSETGAVISVDEKLYKIANKYDLEGLNKLKDALDSLEDKVEYEELYEQVKQAIFEVENSDNNKSLNVDTVDTTEDSTDTTETSDTTEIKEDTKTDEDNNKKGDVKSDTKGDTKDTTDTTDTTDVIDSGTKAVDDAIAKGDAKETSKAQYIYFDLSAGNVKFNGSTYDGSIYQTIDGVTSVKQVSGNHSSNNQYYIYQSNDRNRSTTGWITNTQTAERERIVIPVYQRNVGESGNVGSTSVSKTNIVNNKSVENVINSWNTSVASTGRTSTSHYIEISGYGSNLEYDVTIDSVWSTNLATSNTVNTGGLLVNGANNSSSKSTFTNSKFKITFEGDNRFGQIFYSALKSDNNILSFDSNNDGSIVVAEFSTSNRNNHFRSIIGGQDSTSAENSYGMVFNSGNIFAGAMEQDNCSAIGGGGNGVGGITVNGGNITAVCATSGAALGGGIGWSSKGGDAYVTINNGNVYAYNYSGLEGSNRVAGVAIGGGSGYTSAGNNNTEVTINGGSVYAESTGGVAIGGGNSARNSAGKAKVYINGGAIRAYSKADPSKNLEASSGIGGGTGYLSGGDATIVITDGKLDTMDLGGGYATQPSKPIGSADITVSGGTTLGRFILNRGTFTMSGGTVNGYAKDNGGAVQINNGTATITGGLIQKCEATNGGAIYMKDGTLNISGGTIAKNSVRDCGGAINIVGGTINITGGDILANEAEGFGGAIYLGGGTLNMSKGSLSDNHAKEGGGIYIGQGDFTLTDGKIFENSASYGGGINISNGNIVIGGGTIENNTASHTGGGISLGGGSFNMSNGVIVKNIAKDGGGFYLVGTEIRLTGGSIIKNTANKDGGGFYIGDGSSAYLSNGIISENYAQNGGAFYQTQSANNSTVQLEGSCQIYNNVAQEGNGGAIYISGGSTFKALGGKVAYNSAESSTNQDGLKAKDATSGVGGGIYILEGIFSMNNGDTQGNAAIFGNTAKYAADDLFASGHNTSFDAIKVTQMQLDDEYIGSDSWFEDYPRGETHLSLVKDNQTDIVSKGRYKDVSSEDTVPATTVLERNCEDYICITMGKSNGVLLINVDDENVQSDQEFVFRIVSDTGVIRLYENVSLANPCKISTLPSGDYTLSLIPSWSWRYNSQFNAKVTGDGNENEYNSQENINFKIYSEQTTTIDTSYTKKENKDWITFIWNRIINVGG